MFRFITRIRERKLIKRREDRIQFKKDNEVLLLILDRVHMGDPNLIEHNDWKYSYLDIKCVANDRYDLYVGTNYMKGDEKLKKEIFTILKNNYYICRNFESKEKVMNIFNPSNILDYEKTRGKTND